MKNIKVKYSYISNIPYEDLEDGSHNFHHTYSMKISNDNGNLVNLLDDIYKNSKIGTISDFEFEILGKKRLDTEILKDFVLNQEVWKEVVGNDRIALEKTIEIREIEPIIESSSLHIYEKRFIIDGNVYRFLRTVGGDEGDERVEILVEKK